MLVTKSHVSNFTGSSRFGRGSYAGYRWTMGDYCGADFFFAQAVKANCLAPVVLLNMCDKRKLIEFMGCASAKILEL